MEVKRAHSKGKVRNSWGVYDAYKFARKNHWFDMCRPLKEKEFYAVIRGINKLLAKEIALGHTVTFPSRMGELELRKYKTGAFMRNGKLKVTYPVNWKETWLLWKNDAEAYKNKIVLRFDNEWIYHVKYNKYNANFENKLFYQFDINTFIKKALSQNIKQGKTDAIW
jgi:hypothetical protein